MLQPSVLINSREAPSTVTGKVGLEIRYLDPPLYVCVTTDQKYSAWKM
jgi:hypothetical protein